MRIAGVIARRLLIVALGAGSALAAVDRVIMADGRIWEGTIESETAVVVKLRIDQAGIRSVLELEKEDIEQIKRNVEPMHAADPRDRERDPEGDPEPALAETRVIELDVEGRFGTDLYPIAFEKVIEYAERREIRHLVLVFDTHGGDAWAALGSVRALRQRPSWMRVYAVVRRAQGVGRWPVFASNQIYMDSVGMMSTRDRGASDRLPRGMPNFTAEGRLQMREAALQFGHDPDLAVSLSSSSSPTRNVATSGQIGATEADELGLAIKIRVEGEHRYVTRSLGLFPAFDVIGAGASQFRSANRAAGRLDQQMWEVYGKTWSPPSSTGNEDQINKQLSERKSFVRRFRGMLERSERLGLDAKWRVPAVEDRVRIAWRALQDD